MKTKSIFFIIPLVVYSFDVLISIGQTNEEFIKSITKHLPPSILDDLKEDTTILNLTNTTVARTINLYGGGQTVIRFKNVTQTPEDHGMISHEVFHAVTFLMERVGIQLDVVKSGEAFAYLIGYITTEIYKHL